jgi:hypothetical protein
MPKWHAGRRGLRTLCGRRDNQLLRFLAAAADDGKLGSFEDAGTVRGRLDAVWRRLGRRGKGFAEQRLFNGGVQTEVKIGEELLRDPQDSTHVGYGQFELGKGLVLQLQEGLLKDERESAKRALEVTGLADEREGRSTSVGEKTFAESNDKPGGVAWPFEATVREASVSLRVGSPSPVAVYRSRRTEKRFRKTVLTVLNFRPLLLSPPGRARSLKSTASSNSSRAGAPSETESEADWD